MVLEGTALDVEVSRSGEVIAEAVVTECDEPEVVVARSGEDVVVIKPFQPGEELKESR